MPYQIIVSTTVPLADNLQRPQGLVDPAQAEIELGTFQGRKFRLVSTVASTARVEANNANFVEVPVIVYTMEL